MATIHYFLSSLKKMLRNFYKIRIKNTVFWNLDLNQNNRIKDKNKMTKFKNIFKRINLIKTIHFPFYKKKNKN